MALSRELLYGVGVSMDQWVLNAAALRHSINAVLPCLVETGGGFWRRLDGNLLGELETMGVQPTLQVIRAERATGRAYPRWSFFARCIMTGHAGQLQCPIVFDLLHGCAIHLSTSCAWCNWRP